MSDLIPAIGQTVLSLIFGALLFFWWRRIAGRPGTPIFWIVTLGFLARLGGGQLLFWISYLELPIGRSLQAAKGFWFFALDGIYYFDRASDAARLGFDAILHIARNEAAVFYIQTLATYLLLFGFSPAGALLMNITAFLGMCAITLHLAPPHATRSRLWGIAAMSLTPSAILWSLQPLKDIFFLFLVAAFIFVCDLWQRLTVRADETRGLAWRRAATALLMAVVVYCISGTRWYFGMALIAATALFFLLIFFRAGRHRWVAAAWSPVILLLMVVAFRYGGGPYIPPAILRVITFAPKSTAEAAGAQRAVLETLERSRKAFDATGGATAIGAGRKTQPPKDAVVATPAPSTAAPAATATSTPSTTTTSGTAAVPAPSTARPAETVPPTVEQRPAPVEPTPAAVESTPAPVHATPAPAVTTQAPSAAEATRAVNPPAREARPARASTPVRTVAAAEEVSPPPPITTTTPVPPVAATSAVTAPPQEVVLPSSKVARLVSGMAAVVLPKFVAEALGLLKVGGGRGLWLFVEIDTLVFDAVLLYALYCVFTRFRTAVRTPSFWLIVAIMFLVGMPLIYTVSNFGTLFRHRNMIFLTLTLLPLTIGVALRPTEAAEPPLESEPV